MSFYLQFCCNSTNWPVIINLGGYQINIMTILWYGIHVGSYVVGLSFKCRVCIVPNFAYLPLLSSGYFFSQMASEGRSNGSTHLQVSEKGIVTFQKMLLRFRNSICTTSKWRHLQGRSIGSNSLSISWIDLVRVFIYLLYKSNF